MRYDYTRDIYDVLHYLTREPVLHLSVRVGVSSQVDHASFKEVIDLILLQLDQQHMIIDQFGSIVLRMIGISPASVIGNEAFSSSAPISLYV